jgi:enamine deaminase RidA (YjgF/YER057c/UK114 family)
LTAPDGYSHGVLVAAGAPCLYVTGQVGVTADGKLGESFEKQAQIACSNLLAILEAAAHACARPSGSALLVVAALARSDWRVEIDGVAVLRPACTP